MDINEASVLLVEPYYSGSHKQLIDLLAEEIPGSAKVTLPGKKWHWRARTSALYLSQTIPHSETYRVIFCSCVLNLAELVALRPDLGKLKKIIYFHENQLVYPVRKQQDRDFQYGYNQILSCLVADVVVFNSRFNMDSFLDTINHFLKLMPDFRPKCLADQIRPKCKVLYFPINFPGDDTHTASTVISTKVMENETEVIPDRTVKPAEDVSNENVFTPQVPVGILDTNVNSGILDRTSANKSELSGCIEVTSSKSKIQVQPKTHSSVESQHCIHIVWPHRWEHDKNPTLFFQTMYALKEEGFNFSLSVLGETYTDVPDIFHEAKERLSSHIVHWGFLPTKEDYFKVLRSADVVVSTADHEFFGVAMLEATYLLCYPLCPNKLVYPEIFPDQCLYNTANQLLKKLRSFCKIPNLLQKKNIGISFDRFSWTGLEREYRKLLEL